MYLVHPVSQPEIFDNLNDYEKQHGDEKETIYEEQECVDSVDSTLNLTFEDFDDELIVNDDIDEAQMSLELIC